MRSAVDQFGLSSGVTAAPFELLRPPNALDLSKRREPAFTSSAAPGLVTLIGSGAPSSPVVMPGSAQSRMRATSAAEAGSGVGSNNFTRQVPPKSAPKKPTPAAAPPVVQSVHACGGTPRLRREVHRDERMCLPMISL